MKDKEKTKNQPISEPTKKKQILIVEDERVVVKDIKMSVQKLGYAVSGIALSGEEAVKKAEELHPDLVLMDIILEGKMNGMDAAEIIRSRFNIPIVYLTAHSDKKTLERAKQAEPFGYILKPFSDSDLSTTIEMALYKHKMEDTLKESEKRFRQFFDNAPVYCYMISPEGKILDINSSALTALGYTKEEIAGKPLLTTIYAPSSIEKAKELFIRWKKTGEIRNEEITIITKKGEERTVLLNTDAIRDSAGNLVHSISIQRDITELKKAEETLRESEKRFRQLFEGISDAVMVLSSDGKFLDCNEVTPQRLGYSRKEFLHLVPADIVHPEFHKTMKENQRKIWAGKKTIVESAHICKDGSIIPVELNARKIEYKGESAILAVVRDITERKKAEETLKESEEFNYALFKHNPIQTIAVDNSGRVTNFNMAKRTSGDRLPNIGDVMYKDYAGKHEINMHAELMECINSKKVKRFPEMKYRDKYLDITLAPFPQGAIITTQDITERKQAEEALKESEGRYRDLVEKADIGILIDDREGNIKYFNEKYMEMLKYSRKEMKKQSIKSMVHPDDVDRALKYHKNRIQGRRTPSRYEYRSIRKDGSTIHLEVDAVALRENGEITGSRSYIWDITERKMAEEKLQMSEERYRALFEQAADSIVLVDGETGALAEFNDIAYENLGYTRKEFEKLKIPDFETIESPEEVKKHIKKIIKEGSASFETTHKTKEGKIKNIHVTSRAIAIRGKNFVQSIWQDITKRKQAEEAFREKEEETRIRNKILEIFLTIPPEQMYAEILQFVLKTIKSEYGTFGYFNESGAFVIPSMTREIYWDKCQVPDKEIIFQKSTFRGIWANAIKEKKVLYSNSGPFKTPKGHVPIKNTLIAPIIYQDKVISTIHIANKLSDYDEKDKKLLETISENIAPVLHARLESEREESQRKAAEDALRQSEMTYRTLFESGNDPVLILSLNGTLISVNQKTADTLGYKVEEMIGMSYKDIIAPNEIQDAENKLKSFKKSKDFPPYERYARKKNGTEFPTEVNVSIVHDEENKPAFIQSIFRDITERKREEKELKASREQLRNLAAYLQTVREGERTSIAREIHDDLGQSLTALKMDLSLLTPKLPKDQKSLLKRTESMSKLIDSTIQTVQRISAEMRPGVLDDIGLPAALEWQGNEFQKRTGIKCELTVDPEDMILDKDRSTAIFRIFQETLTNVARHSKAKWIKVNLKKRARKIELKVRDNGKGITEEQISNSKSFGLIGIRERVQFFGGEVEIKGIQNRGTTLTAWIPLPKEKKN